MGTALSTAAGEAGAGEEGITVVSHGAARPSDGGMGGTNDAALLQQLSELKHSLPLIPDSIQGSTSGSWSKTLQRTLPGIASSSGPGSSAAPPLPPPAHLDASPLEQLVADYQRFSRWHCRRIVEKQERLNATIPRVERQALHLQRRLEEAARAAAAEQAALAAAADVRREVEAVAARLARLQQSLVDLEEGLAPAQRPHGGEAGGGGGSSSSSGGGGGGSGSAGSG